MYAFCDGVKFRVSYTHLYVPRIKDYLGQFHETADNFPIVFIVLVYVYLH